MGAISKWLLHEDRKDIFEFLFALVVNILFLMLITLLLWPLGHLTLAFRLAKGYGILWPLISAIAVLVYRIQRRFRVNIYDHPNAFVISNLTTSGLVQAGWSAFVVLTLHGLLGGTPIWMMVILYLVAALACYIAFLAISVYYQGELYKLVNLVLGLASFLVFSLWPASAQALYGWFFELF